MSTVVQVGYGSNLATDVTGTLPQARLPVGVQATNWYLDPVSGVDAAGGGLTSVTPLKTFAYLSAIVAPLGGPWVITQDTTLNYMSDTPAGVDVLPLVIRSYNGAKFLITAAKTGVTSVNGLNLTAATSTFTAVTTRDRTLATMSPWKLTDSALAAANTWTSYLGLMIYNTTRSTYTWVNKDLGTKQCRSFEPMQVAAPTASKTSNVTLVSTVSGDSYQILSPIKVNITAIDFVAYSSTNGTAPGTFFGWGIWFQDTLNANAVFPITGPGGFASAGGYCFRLCAWDAVLELHSVTYMNNCCSNSLTIANGAIGGWAFGGGAMKRHASALSSNVVVGGSFSFDQDFMFTDHNFLNLTGGQVQFGTVGLFSVTNVNIGGNLGFQPGQLIMFSQFSAAPICWGDVVVIKVHSNSSISMSGTAVSNFTCGTAFTLAGQSLGCTYVRATGVFTGNIATTWANVDSNNGSLFDPLSGSGVYLRA